MTSERRGMPRFLRSRIFWIFLLFALFFSAVALRLFFLQVVKADELKARAEDQQMREVPVEANRGLITDRNGNVLAASVSVDSVYASPTQINKEEAPEIARELGKILNLAAEDILAKLTSGRGYEWIKRKISQDEAAAIRSLDYDGIGFTTETKRDYPGGMLAAHLLGFVGIDNQGLEGIEAVYDEKLLGRDGYILAQYDSHGSEIA
ncbi:MAG: hypothetical protein Q4C00_02285, partial [Bacillota bacterium]|nr:hypothetical protein [Bacillota bacterium]